MPILTFGTGVTLIGRQPVAEAPPAGGSLAFLGTGTGYEPATTASSWPIDNYDGVASGQLLVMIVAHSSGTTVTVTPASGWTAVTGSPQQAGGGNTQYLRAYWKIAGASEASSYTWGFSANVSGAAMVLAYENSHATTPIDAQAFGQSVGAGSTITGSSVSPTQTGDQLLYVGMTAGTRTFPGTPAGMTERYEQDNNPSLYIATETLVSSGPTGTRAATASSNAHWASLMLAIRGA